jgi:hypothetical protein
VYVKFAEGWIEVYPYKTRHEAELAVQRELSLGKTAADIRILSSTRTVLDKH